MTDLELLVKRAKHHLDALERFLALYDMNRLLNTTTPNAHDACWMLNTFIHVEENDRDPHVRSWARYYRRRLVGEVPPTPKPYLPEMWQLLIVE